ncbi:hypothetical protein NGM07_11425 [Halorussus vallis]|nr:hypothetical protein NGM07_11425 [Halorussus vallis]
MPNRTEMIGVRVTPEEKEEFQKHIDETNEFDSIPRMMRTLVKGHINSDGQQDVAIDEEDLIRSMDVALSPVVERLERLEEHITEIDAQTSDDDEIDKLARSIYESLPEYLDGEELPDMEELAHRIVESEHSVAHTVSTPSVWAQYFGVEPSEARRACALMLKYYPDVEFDTIEMGDIDVDMGEKVGDIRISERRYYKNPGSV